MKYLFITLITTLSFQSLFAGQWQQKVNYKIDVKLNDHKHTLNGELKLLYKNNSPDTLHKIYMHLWPNAYKNIHTAFARQQLENSKTEFYTSDENERGYIDSLHFLINSEETNWEYHPEHTDIAVLRLKKPLLPGEAVTISTPFHVKIPKTFSRLGHVGESYQITQWYPKPAVYDQAGWHPMPYLDQGEFYSEYGSFDVTITLPENYVVGATGVLQNEKELRWLNKKDAETRAVLERLKNQKEEQPFPPSSEKMKTITFHADNVHDFAWFADKRFHVLKGEAELPSGRKVPTWSMFTDREAGFWKKGPEYLHDAVTYYSKWIGEYPYPQVTAVESALSAGAGMEYPMITVIGAMSSPALLEKVIVHEVGHNWFYGILGSNERIHPWMDEGINSFYENRYFEEKYPGMNMFMQTGENKILEFFDLHHYPVRYQHEILYLLQARRNLDQPVDLKATEYTEINYGAIVYGKAALLFNYLFHYLGEKGFDRVMQLYFDQWKFRHPRPEDLETLFNEETGKYLDWFFDGLLGTDRLLDYSIKDLKDTIHVAGRILQRVTVKNEGKVKGPFLLAGMKDDKVVYSYWIGGFHGEMDVNFPDGDYDEFMIDPDGVMPEINRKNNRMRTRGMLKKTEKLRLQLIGSIENPNRTQLFILPTLNWNYYDGYMTGLSLYSNIIPPQKFEFAVNPMYAFNSKTVTGSIHTGYHFYPRESITFRRVRLYFSAFRYSYGNGRILLPDNETSEAPLQYHKLKPELEFTFKKKTARSPVEKKLRWRTYLIDLEKTPCPETAGVNCTDPYFLLNDYYVNELEFSWQNNKTLNPYSFNMSLHQSENFVKPFAEAEYKLSYSSGKKGVRFRWFGGGFIYNDNANSIYRLQLGSDFGFGAPGYSDYLLEENYLARHLDSGWMSQQIAIKDGGFKTRTFVGSNSKWLTSLNVNIDLPGKIPLSVFADGGLYPGTDNINGAYDGGVTLNIIPGMINIYFPLAYSENIKNNLDLLTDSYWEKITFRLKVEENILKRIRNLEL